MRLEKLMTTVEHSDSVLALFVAESALVLKQRLLLERAHLRLEAPEDHETHRPPLVELLERQLCGQVFFERQLFWA
jgi:hypothetical protein